MSHIDTIDDKTTKPFNGDVFLCCGCALLTLESGNRYLLEDDEFIERLVSLFRSKGLRDHTDAKATGVVELIVSRAHSAEYVAAGFGYPEHRVASVVYEVEVMTVTLNGESFVAGKDVCREIEGLEIQREFL